MQGCHHKRLHIAYGLCNQNISNFIPDLFHPQKRKSSTEVHSLLQRLPDIVSNVVAGIFLCLHAWGKCGRAWQCRSPGIAFGFQTLQKVVVADVFGRGWVGRGIASVMIVALIIVVAADGTPSDLSVQKYEGLS